MQGKKIKQINNLVITQDTSKGINYFGSILFNPNYGKHSVWAPDGRCIENGLSLEQAEEFCKNTKNFIANKDSLSDKIAFAEQEKLAADSKDVELEYGEMKKLFKNVENTHKGHVCGHIVFSTDSFTEPYSEEARTYVVSSDNKAFQPNMGGYSIYGSSLDGSDVCVRLDMYMCFERGGKCGWQVERCYMKRDEFDKANKIIAEKELEEER